MDSLQATRLRSMLILTLDTSGHKLGLNVAFEYPTINLLASHLEALRSGATHAETSIEDQIRGLIAKYGNFEQHRPWPNGLGGKYIGPLDPMDANVVAKLSILPDVQKIYCLVRAGSPIDGYGRLLESLRARRVNDTLPTAARKKLIVLPSTLSRPTLGLDKATYNTLTSEITDIIHCAWSVNFNLHLRSFETDNIPGLINLITLSLKAQRLEPASLNFCSSISTVVNSEASTIPESILAKLHYAQNMGYAQSKLVSEYLCAKATQQTSLRSRILRIGQVIGNTAHGIWNTTEAIPLMLQSAITIGSLPRLDETHRWLPVNSVADIIVNIALSSSIESTKITSDTDADENPNTGKGGFCNIVSPHPFHWTRDLIPYLRSAGLEFEELEPRAWLRRLRESNPDPASNLPIKLVDFFAGKYDTDAPRRALHWDTERTARASSTFRGVQALDEELVGKILGYFRGECCV